jgi:hypothetical protein
MEQERNSVNRCLHTAGGGVKTRDKRSVQNSEEHNGTGAKQRQSLSAYGGWLGQHTRASDRLHFTRCGADANAMPARHLVERVTTALAVVDVSVGAPRGVHARFIGRHARALVSVGGKRGVVG